MASTLNCIGVLYFHMPKAETVKAMELYLESLAICRAILGDKHCNIATTLNSIGRVHYMNGNYDDALVTYVEALCI
eukprot:11166325-Ditylum_brightwellii.AAC.1